MAAKGVSAEMVDGVVVDCDGILELEVFDCLDNEPLAGTIVGDEVFEALALRGGVFEVGADGINVEPSTVTEKASALGRFKDVVASMVIDGSDLAFKEEVVLDGFDDVFWASEVVVHDQATELGLDSKYAVVNGVHGWVQLFYVLAGAKMTFPGSNIGRLDAYPPTRWSVSPGGYSKESWHFENKCFNEVSPNLGSKGSEINFEGQSTNKSMHSTLEKWSFFDVGPTARIEWGGLSVLFEDWEESNDIGAGNELFASLDEVKAKFCPIAAGDIVTWGAHGDEVSSLLDLECGNFELYTKWGDGSSGNDIKSFSLFDFFGSGVFDGEIVSSVAVEEAKHFAVGVEGGHFKVRKCSRDWPTWNSGPGTDVENSCSGVQIRNYFSDHYGIEEVPNIAVLPRNSGEVHHFVCFVEILLKIFEFGELLLREADSQFVACGG